MSNKTDNSVKFEGYTVRELKLKQMRSLQSQNISKEDMQYQVACLCVTKEDGSFITMEELDDLSVKKATKLLQIVAKLNGAEEEADEKGNA